MASFKLGPTEVLPTSPRPCSEYLPSKETIAVALVSLMAIASLFAIVSGVVGALAQNSLLDHSWDLFSNSSAYAAHFFVGGTIALSVSLYQLLQMYLQWRSAQKPEEPPPIDYHIDDFSSPHPFPATEGLVFTFTHDQEVQKGPSDQPPSMLVATEVPTNEKRAAREEPPHTAPAIVHTEPAPPPPMPVAAEVQREAVREEPEQPLAAPAHVRTPPPPQEVTPPSTAPAPPLPSLVDLMLRAHPTLQQRLDQFEAGSLEEFCEDN